MTATKRRTTQLLTLWIAWILCTLFTSVLVWGERFDASPSYNEERVRLVTCCDLVEKHWSLLYSWHSSCVKKNVGLEGIARRFWVSPPPAELTSSVPMCVERGQSLSVEFLKAFLEKRLCVGLPVTHTELVRSVYSVFVAENPLSEDELVTLIEEACVKVQQVGIKTWRRSLDVQTVKEAQQIVCAHHCPNKQTIFDGDIYDL
ncbi:putative phosphomannomutase-like protein [Trypanosoma theileri]|uniref:Putative phosphomannomutase-like protein n=1 Tax=Trypanosoma theileri TaxID=67003 RepID=A0A1X0NQW2_9TRYP|nr:putative phosphomannomutase-like protein [Trypanosoma theileri]ORC86873.1 putative phosphomannomutase-like protein [Trypanosoma theileri]